MKLQKTLQLKKITQTRYPDFQMRWLLGFSTTDHVEILFTLFKNPWELSIKGALQLCYPGPEKKKIETQTDFHRNI